MRNIGSLALAMLMASGVMAQDAGQSGQAATNGSNSNQSDKGKWGEVHGNVQFDTQIYNPDTAIGAPPVPEKLLMNGFTNLIYTKGKFTVGIRYENYLNVIQGFDQRYKGQGIAYRYASFESDFLGITVGNFYEQFGSGMVLRTYVEPGLGFDNSIDGARVKAHVLGGVYVKGVIGKQRSFFDHGPGIVRGIDGEIVLNETIKKLADAKTRFSVGGSFVSKYQEDDDPDFELPENVGAWAARFNLTSGKFGLNGEYASKINDPQASNTFLYEGVLRKNYSPGSAVLLNATFATEGLGVIVSAKRTQNMDFRSDRYASGFNLNINYLPALTKQHTYLLAASLYPYATQPNGEWAVQGEVSYQIKRGSKLGGKYGTYINLNYSHAYGLDTVVNDAKSGLDASFFGHGSLYFRDINVEISRKFTKDFKAAVKYFNITYNKDVVQGLVGYGTINAHIAVLDLTYKVKPKHALRLELQGLFTSQDQGSWAVAMLEYTWSPHFFVAVLDQWNYSNPHEEKRLHYPYIQVGYTHNASRITLSYGRQRAGIFCVGGICRNVPASNGVSLSITTSF